MLARPLGPAGKVARWCRRQPVRAGLIAALILTFLLGLMGILWQLSRARAGEVLALRQAYAGDIKEAQRALEEGDLGGARRTLDKYRPGKPASGVRQPTLAVDLRGWEWRYLWGQCRSDEQFTLTNQPMAFENLALSPDGSLLAVRQPGGNIDLWDWATRRQTGTLTNGAWRGPWPSSRAETCSRRPIDDTTGPWFASGTSPRDRSCGPSRNPRPSLPWRFRPTANGWQPSTWSPGCASGESARANW